MFSQYSAIAEHHKENCAPPIQLCQIHAIFLVMFSHCRILREHSIVFLHFSLQDYCEEQQKISAYILLIILQEYCQNYAVTVVVKSVWYLTSHWILLCTLTKWYLPLL